MRGQRKPRENAVLGSKRVRKADKEPTSWVFAMHCVGGMSANEVRVSHLQILLTAFNRPNQISNHRRRGSHLREQDHNAIEKRLEFLVEMNF